MNIDTGTPLKESDASADWTIKRISRLIDGLPNQGYIKLIENIKGEINEYNKRSQNSANQRFPRRLGEGERAGTKFHSEVREDGHDE
jgi:hypothetical protein